MQKLRVGWCHLINSPPLDNKNRCIGSESNGEEALFEPQGLNVLPNRNKQYNTHILVEYRELHGRPYVSRHQVYA